ncbi:hypothetical protein CLF_106229 [Clonorchis sinensis]|uniref:Pol-related protein n=1 Tax=Clonorchis sinensis TaxID=79923 RepID=G7YEU3_CLOSI|nr:hypothetical protein CLF_106229 [Clonorchis sinensis]
MHGEKGPEDITRIDAKKDLGIWLSPNLSFSLHLEKSAQKAFAVLRRIRRGFSRVTRIDIQILYGGHVRPLPEYANPVVYSGRTKDTTIIERVQRTATKMVADFKFVDYETRLVVFDLLALEYCRLRGDLLLNYFLFEQDLADRRTTAAERQERNRPGKLGGKPRSCVSISESLNIKSMDYETRLAVLDLFPLEYRRLRGDLITYALFEQGLANRFFTVDPANTRQGHGERQLLNDKNKTNPGNLGKSLAPVYQSVREITNRRYSCESSQWQAYCLALTT